MDICCIKRDINLSKPHSSNYYTLPYRPNLPFFKIPEHQSAQMSETINGRLGLYGAEHSKCNHKMALGFKVLTFSVTHDINDTQHVVPVSRSIAHFAFSPPYNI